MGFGRLVAGGADAWTEDRFPVTFLVSVSESARSVVVFYRVGQAVTTYEAPATTVVICDGRVRLLAAPHVAAHEVAASVVGPRAARPVGHSRAPSGRSSGVAFEPGLRAISCVWGLYVLSVGRLPSCLSRCAVDDGEPALGRDSPYAMSAVVTQLIKPAPPFDYGPVWVWLGLLLAAALGALVLAARKLRISVRRWGNHDRT